MEESDFGILVKSSKGFVVLRSEVLPRIADLAGILEVAEALVAFAVLLVKNIISTVGVERNSEPLY